MNNVNTKIFSTCTILFGCKLKFLAQSFWNFIFFVHKRVISNNHFILFSSNMYYSYDVLLHMYFLFSNIVGIVSSEKYNVKFSM